MKIKMLDLVEGYLKREPTARERKNRAIAVWNILYRKYNMADGATISREFFVDCFFKDTQTCNRSINRVQQLNPELRGSDYEDKEVLEQEAQLEQGYMPGFNSDLKKLKKL